jgi:hypothetical protein
MPYHESASWKALQAAKKMLNDGRRATIKISSQSSYIPEEDIPESPNKEV